MVLKRLRLFLLVFLLPAASAALTGCNGFFVDGHTTTTLTSSAVNAAYETSVVLTAKVKSDGNLLSGDTGTVEFFSDSVEIGSATLSGGQASYTTSSLAVGTHTIYAEYVGDSSYNESESSDLTVVISETLTATTTALAASATTLTAGSTLTLTATVDVSAVTGSVSFYDNTTGTPVLLGTVTAASGIASLSTTTLASGSHILYATYIGDSNYASSTSGSVSVTVN